MVSELASPLLLRRVLYRNFSRGYFYHNPGDTGIWAATWERTFLILKAFIFFGAPLAGYHVLGGRWGGGMQFAPFASDLYLSDGTELEGEEAVADIKIKRDRIMPFMDDIRKKVEASKNH